MKAVRENSNTEQQSIQDTISGADAYNTVQVKTNRNSMILNKDLLPSKGLTYPNEITIRKLNAKEIKDLSTLQKDNVNAIVNKILGACIEGMKVSDILINDKLWLVYFLRSYTYDDFPFKVKGRCESCNRESVFDFKLANLDTSYYDKVLPDTITLPNGDKLHCTFPTIGSEIQVNRLKNDTTLVEAIDEDIMLIAAHIKTVNGETMSIQEAYDYLNRQCSAVDFASLIKQINECNFGAKPVGKFTCDCGEEVSAMVNLTQDFFLPKF